MRITVNGRPLEVEGSKDLLTTCLSAGIEIPHFCWHGDLARSAPAGSARCGCMTGRRIPRAGSRWPA